MPDNCTHAVVITLDVDLHNAIKIVRSCALDRTNVRNACIVDQDIDSLTSREFLKFCAYFARIRYVALIREGTAASGSNLVAGLGCGRAVEITNVNCRATCRKFKGNCLSDAAARPRDNRDFAVESKRIRIGAPLIQSDTPRFQGMKSSCALISALVRTWPLATRLVKSRISSPIC